MKESLFYTFLVIFAVTAIITLLGVIKKVKIERRYLNALFTALLIQLAGAVVGLFSATDFFAAPLAERVTFKEEDVAIDIRFSTDDWVAVGHYNVTKGRNAEAVAAYEKALTDLKDSFEVWYGKGLAHFNDDQWQAAYDAFKNASEIREEAAAYMNAAISLKNLERFEDAIRYFESAIRSDSEVSKIYYNYGNMYFERADYTKAIDQLRTATQKDSQYSKAWFLKARCYYELGNREDFIRCLRITLRLAREYRAEAAVLFVNYLEDSEVARIMQTAEATAVQPDRNATD